MRHLFDGEAYRRRKKQISVRHSKLKFLVRSCCIEIVLLQNPHRVKNVWKIRYTISSKTFRMIISIIEFIASKENNPFECRWIINGTGGKPIYLALNYLTIGGDCSQSSINFTFKRYATIDFHSSVSFRHAFKVSFKSYIEVEEPFSDNVRGDIGVILAIVLGIVLLGSMFVAVTFCTIKLYLRCKNRDPEPSEMTAITNIRAETMRAITLKDDFDIKPLSRLVRAKTGSTERILQTREAYA
ncbi:unnamed protein product [Mytilus edulis]|uniref:Uncharacterized protein n=1 Tax=Mytilus edulis TaxID=6550 RepID=A0A8S3RAF4_MYTED|nr:unnamed protein product [Mytilus edulis]